MFSSKEKLSSNCPRSYPSFVYDSNTTFFDSEWTDVMNDGEENAWIPFRALLYENVHLTVELSSNYSAVIISVITIYLNSEPGCAPSQSGPLIECSI
jgi:hypothetical protein